VQICRDFTLHVGSNNNTNRFLNSHRSYFSKAIDPRELNNEELHNLYSSSGIIRIIKSRKMRWAGHMARMGAKRNVYMLLVGKPEGKRPPGRPRRRWIDNIKVDLLEIRLSVVDWIGLVQDRCRWRALVNSVMDLRFHKMPGNYRVAAQLVVSRAVLISTELVS
jgi:hypothetical protein